MKNITFKLISIIFALAVTVAGLTACGKDSTAADVSAHDGTERSAVSSAVSEESSMPQYTVDDSGNIVNAETGEAVTDGTLAVDENGSIVNSATGEVITDTGAVTANKAKLAETAANNTQTADNTAAVPAETSGEGSNAGTGSKTNTHKGNTQQTAAAPEPTPAPAPEPEPEPSSSGNAEIDWSEVKIWTVADYYSEEEYADRIIYYINQLRMAEGKSAMTAMNGKAKQFSQIRAKQLTTNFAHDNTDTKAAATEAEYGIKTEETKLDRKTMTAVPTGKYYYMNYGGEAIQKGSILLPENGDPDWRAKRVAAVFQNSAGHWRYVGSEDNKYISCGVAYVAGEAYICVIVSDTDIYD